MLHLIDEFSIVCRCEEINRAEIEESIDAGARTLDDIKRLTRCGMGACQWKTCKTTVEKILQHKLPHQDIKADTPSLRYPLFPIEIKKLVSMKAYKEVKPQQYGENNEKSV
ncbi:(2Fe-2S)-binding protein [Bacillus tianshenii]|nr:(2Fe-2S)-binding protein [Bacillus tianshenii]